MVLKLILVLRNVSQGDIAEAIGVSGAQVSRWLSGQRSPTPEQAQALADLLKVDLSYIWAGQIDSDKVIDKLGELVYAEPTVEPMSVHEEVTVPPKKPRSKR